MIDEMDGWKNRIVGNGEVAAGDLVANPFNARRHPKAQEQIMQAAACDT